jgi:RelA/SpoT family (p)ppGpp synthetase
MRTLVSMPMDKQRRIARETMDIYVPIANRLGMNTMRLELEDLCFSTQYPGRYRVISEAVRKARGNRKQLVGNVDTAVKRRMRQEKIEGSISGREKHPYSIYKKMRDKKLPFAEVFDVYAFRIVVDKVDTCYRVLGMMHNLFKPVPGRFKDYIAIPKSNGYQSLHTVLFGPHGVPVEIQIRSTDMNQFAESGIAAHWLYKLNDDSSSAAQARAHKWVHGLLEMQKGAGDSIEFIENVKIDLFPDEVYVFTPAGEIMELPRGATVVDFAYAVHTDIGNTCVAGKINRRLAPLRTVLLNGQTVEIVTAPGARPNPTWLNFVATGKARANIRSFLKTSSTHEAVVFGQRLLQKELEAHGRSAEDMDFATLAPLLEEFGLKKVDELLAEIGLGNRLPRLVVRRMIPESEDVHSGDHQEGSRPLMIKGTEGMVVNMARCCHPIPGDPIIGLFSAGSGINIHHAACTNLTDFRKRPDTWIEVEWSPDRGGVGEFLTEIRVDVANRRGVLATVAATISEQDCNVENVSIDERDGMTSAMIFTIAVSDRTHLANVMRQIRLIQSVMRITRLV